MLSRHRISLLRKNKFLTEYDPNPGVSVATLAHEYPSKFQVPEHVHGSNQLIYAISSVMEVFSDQSMRLIPPHFAVWIPARTTHRIHMPGPVSMRTLYLRTGLPTRLEPLRCPACNVAATRTYRRNRKHRSASYAGSLRVCPSRPANSSAPGGLPGAHVCDTATRGESTCSGSGNIAKSGRTEADGKIKISGQSRLR